MTPHDPELRDFDPKLGTSTPNSGTSTPSSGTSTRSSRAWGQSVDVPYANAESFPGPGSPTPGRLGRFGWVPGLAPKKFREF